MSIEDKYPIKYDPLIQSQNRLFHNLIFIVWGILGFYTIINLFTSSTYSIILFSFAALIVSPLMLYLEYKKLLIPAKLLLITQGNFFIYVGSVLFGMESGSEYFYFCALIVPLLIFDLRSKKYITYSILLAVFFWVLSAFPHEWLSSFLYLEKEIPQPLFRKINFVTAFLMLMVILRALVASITHLQMIIIDQQTHERLITEKKNKDLIRASRLSSIGELAAGVGHEINNPLAIAAGNLSLIHKAVHSEVAANPKLAEYFEKHKTAFARIAKIVDGLRTFARADLMDNEVCSIQDNVKKTRIC